MLETPRGRQMLKEDPLWYKDAVIYELHVRAFYDSNGDGIGDFAGLIQKLDYLSDLGVTAIWLLPFYPSPLKDDGYDIADYMSINPAYGTLKDFRQLLRESHARGMRVITELVINHTSDQHEWFQKSRRAKPGSYWRDFYVWSDDPSRYKGTRIIFKDFETSNWTWDPVAKSYYWHRFYSHQPDLNFDNPEVQKAVLRALDFWMDMGVDGMRLDAVPYLFERERTSCENLPETHDFLKKLRRHVDGKYPNRMLLAEANQWPEDAVPYFGEGDECHMCFHFPLMPRLFMALKMEDRYSILDILRQTPEIPENCQWATFLRNHDELTLEMVTDEERDYMQKVYATDPRARINLGIRRRLAPLVGNDRRQVELLNALLFSLPGSPVIYYGDEIGMGDNIYLGDRDGVRTPFQWSPDRNAGFSKANPQSLYLPVIVAPEYHAEALNVETQQGNVNSLLWWMKKLISLRKQYSGLSRGRLEFLDTSNPKVLAYRRVYDGKSLLCVANLSRSVQYVELDLSAFRGFVPVEIFGHTDFPPIGDLPYFLTLGPYAFYWFEMVEKQSVETGQWLVAHSAPTEVWDEPLRGLETREIWSGVAEGVRNFLPRMRWFAGKGRKITSVQAEDVVLFPHLNRTEQSALVVVRVNYVEGDPEYYNVALSYAEGERAQRLREERPDLVVAEYVRSGHSGIYYDAILDAGFSEAVLDTVIRRRTLNGTRGQIETEVLGSARKEWLKDLPAPTLSGLEQSNSSVLFGKRFYLKIYRRLDEGENPEIEVGRFLTKRRYPNAPPMIGALRYQRGRRLFSIGIVQGYSESEMDGWRLIVDHVGKIAEQALAQNLPDICLTYPQGTLADLRQSEPPEAFRDIAGYTFGLARLLGTRTAEMHRALGDEDRDTAFIPEAFTPFHQRSIFQSFRNLTVRTLDMVRSERGRLAPEIRELADAVLESEEAIYRAFSFVKDVPLEIQRIRIHGDYHLGQVLFTGEDFIVVDFEGEPARSLGERRLKRSCLKDVAGMLRSFDYAAEYYLKELVIRDEDRGRLRPCLRSWSAWMANQFMNGYLETMGASELIPRSLHETELLTQVFILEKALYEIGYEIRSRPNWVDIPLRGVLDTLRKRMT